MNAIDMILIVAVMMTIMTTMMMMTIIGTMINKDQIEQKLKNNEEQHG
jgi:hypothetical protein